MDFKQRQTGRVASRRHIFAAALQNRTNLQTQNTNA
jgi:hypothetical protein